MAWQRGNEDHVKSEKFEEGVGSAVPLLLDVDNLGFLRLATVAQGGRRCQTWGHLAVVSFARLC